MKTYILLIIVTNIFILFFQNKLIKIFNLYDKPDYKRKIHENNISLIGGSIIIFNLLIYFLYHIKDNSIFEFSNTSLLSLSFGSLMFYLLGLYDDKLSISPSKKLLLQIFILFVLINLNEKLIVSELKFSFNNYSFFLGKYSVFFSILCILLFINALNMFDGINLQSGIFCIIVFFIILIFSIKSYILITLIISCFVFLILNFQNKAFLGDNGSHLLGFLISFFLITESNNNNLFLKVEDIFILLSIPGLDMLRLFIIRLINNKNPFLPDRQHLHHLLLLKLGYFKTLFLIQAMIVIPQLANLFFHINKFVIIILTLSSYIYLVSKLNYDK